VTAAPSSPAPAASPSRPYATFSLFAANALVFALQLALAGGLRFALGGADRADARRWSAVLRWLGGNDALFTIADTRLETLLASCFLHGSIVHLGLNMVVLVQVGPFLERAVGVGRFLPLYLGAGVVASTLSAIAGKFSGAALSIGASGAICGLIGAVLVLGVRTQGWKGPLTRHMAGWLAGLIVLGLAKNVQGGMVQVDNAAHMGGALGGAIIASMWRRGVTYSARAQRLILGICTLLLVGAAGTVFYRNRTDPYLFMNAEARLDAALDWSRQGQCERAEEAFRRALRLAPTDALVREKQSELERSCRTSGLR
jgi:rhomboid protease GluP